MEMTLFETLLQNPQGVTFTALFIALLFYVIKTNGIREENYRETIRELSKALNTFEDLREKVESLLKRG